MKKTTYFVIVFLLIASKTQNLDDLATYDALIASKKGDIKALIKECAQGFVEKNFKKVLACAKAVEKIDASHPEMLSMYASLLTVTKNSTAAIDFLKEKIKTTKNSNPHIALANVYIRLKEDDELIKLLLTAKEKFPKDEKLAQYDAYLEEPKVIANNEKEFEVLLQKEPNNEEFLEGYAHYLFDSGKFLKAIKYYKKVVKINEKDINSFCNISEAYFVLGNREEDQKYKLKALEIAPTQVLNYIIKTNPLDFKKYSKIAQEKFLDNKEMNEFIEMVNKMMM